jgi:iron complex transport system ATP-binding protein
MPERTDDSLFTIKQGCFAVGDRIIVHPLDLTLRSGRFYALVGPNGSGKSTLVKLFARQVAPTSGELMLLGKQAAEYGAREFARTVAYMPQFTPPAEGLNVRELVALGRFPWHGALGTFGEEDGLRVAEALEQTDLTALSDRMVDSLSGGERQRAWLAMMLAQNPQCLFLDEPTSALDIAHQVEILALIRRLSVERGMCVVIVLHDINMAARYCDEIIALRGGRVTAHGAPQEILDGPILEQIYGLPMGIVTPPTGTAVSYVL